MIKGFRDLRVFCGKMTGDSPDPKYSKHTVNQTIRHPSLLFSPVPTLFSLDQTKSPKQEAIDLPSPPSLFSPRWNQSPASAPSLLLRCSFDRSASSLRPNPRSTNQESIDLLLRWNQSPAWSLLSPSLARPSEAPPLTPSAASSCSNYALPSPGIKSVHHLFNRYTN